MGHSIQAILAKAEVADVIVERFAELRWVDTAKGIAILPVDAAFVDRVVEPMPSPQAAGAEFRLLTPGFENLLCELSQLGALAYIETNYHGGVGGQGAAAYAAGREILAPCWDERAINRALTRLGVRRPLLGDRFAAIGLHRFRSNEDLLEAAAG
ncbi:MAG: hypothetical protein DWQ37_22830 [Planctomycetota bacterium]|nr:MAG: hypothetical protein DWQ37_22830 [Planctomycetota bacterium]